MSELAQELKEKRQRIAELEKALLAFRSTLTRLDISATDYSRVSTVLDRILSDLGLPR